MLRNWILEFWKIVDGRTIFQGSQSHIWPCPCTQWRVLSRSRVRTFDIWNPWAIWGNFGIFWKKSPKTPQMTLFEPIGGLWANLLQKCASDTSSGGYLGLQSVKGCQMDSMLSAHVVSRSGSCSQLKQRVAKFLKFLIFAGNYLTVQYSTRERNLPEMCKNHEISDLMKIRSIGPNLMIQKKLWPKNSQAFRFWSLNLDWRTWVHGKSIYCWKSSKFT